MMCNQSLDQQRAAFAWTEVSRAKNTPHVDFGSYTKLAKSGPALIMGNGLMQTLAFLEQKYDERKNKSMEAKALIGSICAWLQNRNPQHIPSSSFSDVMRSLYGEELGRNASSFYIQATEETLEILRWIRQFAPALGED